MIEFDVVAHLDDFIEDGFVELGVVVEIEGGVVVLFAGEELL